MFTPNQAAQKIFHKLLLSMTNHDKIAQISVISTKNYVKDLTYQPHQLVITVPLMREHIVQEESTATPSNLAVFANDIVSAYVSNNSVPPAELPSLIGTIYAALTSISQRAGSGNAATELSPEKLTPAQIRKSITPDALISFINGKPYKTLRRHLTRNGMTPEDYRIRYGLPHDYPSTAPSYSAKRSELAIALGLGQLGSKAAAKAATTAKTVTAAPKKRERTKAS